MIDIKCNRENSPTSECPKLEGARESAYLRQVNFHRRSLSGLYLETCTSNLKSVALSVLELLAFNA